ncbi:hypothetical protein [Dietzia sp. 179-F 9C3 NHS]|uniref:hypothetical protein n=1 Tax=Dietzia sp. 179-F 9C3 NHS TaxID=3374295 RepID=UPI003879CB2F
MDATTYTRTRDEMTAAFGEPIHAVTADDLIAAGDLIDATPVYAQGTGRSPELMPRLLFTRAAWDDLAAWDENNRAYQDVSGRIHDVVTMCRALDRAGRVHGGVFGHRVTFSLLRIPNTRRATVPRTARAVVTVHLDGARPVLTFALPGED